MVRKIGEEKVKTSNQMVYDSMMKYCYGLLSRQKIERMRWVRKGKGKGKEMTAMDVDFLDTVLSLDL